MSAQTITDSTLAQAIFEKVQQHGLFSEPDVASWLLCSKGIDITSSRLARIVAGMLDDGLIRLTAPRNSRRYYLVN